MSRFAMFVVALAIVVASFACGGPTAPSQIPPTTPPPTTPPVFLVGFSGAGLVPYNPSMPYYSSGIATGVLVHPAGQLLVKVLTSTPTELLFVVYNKVPFSAPLNSPAVILSETPFPVVDGGKGAEIKVPSDGAECYVVLVNRTQTPVSVDAQIYAIQ